MKSPLPVIAAAFPLLAGAAAQEVVVLPTWTSTGETSSQRFLFAAPPERPRPGEGWRVLGSPRRYFDELLPALFERTLVVDRLETKGGGLEWIFTGEFGGFTVAADSREIRVSQRYYDSVGYGTPQPPLRHVEKIATQSAVAYQGELHAITVRLDSKLGPSVALNGKEALRQNCLLDVNRHQLAWTGSEGVH